MDPPCRVKRGRGKRTFKEEMKEDIRVVGVPEGDVIYRIR